MRIPRLNNGVHQLRKVTANITDPFFEMVYGLFSSRAICVPLVATYIWIKSYVFLSLVIGVWLQLNASKNATTEIFKEFTYIIQPEKQEIPLYLALTVLFAIFVRRVVLKRAEFSAQTTVFINVTTSFLLILELGLYPMQENVMPTVWLLSLLVIFAVMFLFSRMKQAKFLHSVFILITIILVTYTPGNPISHHDYSYFLGPIYEVSKGKSIFTDVPSQYGFLLIQGLGMLSKYNVFDTSYFPFLVWIGYVAQYFLSFIIIRKVSRSDSFASISVIAIMVINFLSINGLPTSYPQVGPLRWLPLVLSIVFFRLRRKHLFWMAFLFSLASLFVIDSGVYMYVALFTTYMYKLMSGEIDRGDVKFVIFIILNTTLLLALICFGVTLLGYKPIFLSSLFYKIQQYAVIGVGMIPMPTSTYLYLFTFLHFFTVYHYFAKRLNDNSVYIANCFLAASLYYVGRSHPHNLFNISSIALLFLFSILGVCYRKIETRALRRVSIVLIVLLLILVPSYYRGKAITDHFESKIYRYKMWNISKIMYSFSFDQLQEAYKEEIAFLESDPNDSILLVHPDDTYLFRETGKNNLLRENPQSALVLTNEVSKALNDMSSIDCPQNVYVSCNALGLCRGKIFYNTMSVSQIYIYEALRSKCIDRYVLEKYEKNCVKTLCKLTKKTTNSKDGI